MLQAYSRLSSGDAIRAFGEEHHHYCDRQFVAAGSELICLFREAAKIESPTTVRWKPARDYRINEWSFGGPPTWMPQAQQGRYQIFLQSPREARLVYLGPATLSVHATGPDPWALFGLESKLPKAEWLEFGGYAGWEIQGHYRGHLIANDIDGFDRVLEGARNEHFHIGLNRYDGDWLGLYTNARRGLLVYDGRRVVGGDDAELPPEEFRTPGKPHGFCVPATDTITRDEALRLVREFFLTGRFPQDVRWEAGKASDDEWLFGEIVTSLRHLFGYSRKEAEALLGEYNAQRKEWQATHGAEYHSDEMLRHEGPESMAYIIQWLVRLNGDLGSMAFLDWRKSDYQRRESGP